RDFADLFASGAVDAAWVRRWEAARNFPEGWPRDYFGGEFFFDPNGQIQNSTLLDGELNTRINAIREALDDYKTQYGVWPDALDTLVVSKFLQRLPVHPYAGSGWNYDAQTGDVKP